MKQQKFKNYSLVRELDSNFHKMNQVYNKKDTSPQQQKKKKEKKESLIQHKMKNDLCICGRE